ncbi:MAG: hypothetical protein J6W98_02655 [Bacteroidales bacterium]|nr:hypothetical protein [Bacteroidales bacterium]
MSNNEKLGFYVKECVKRYGESHQLCPSVSEYGLGFWLKVVQKELMQMGITDYSPEEIFETFLATYLDKINPVNEQTKKISELLCAYGLQWSEMTIKEDGKPDKVVRPPYVINGTKPSGVVTYNGEKYSLDHLGKKAMVFTKKDVELEMEISKADGASSYSFTINGVAVSPEFKTSGGKTITLVKSEGYGEEARWYFISASEKVNYVKRGRYLFEITKRLAKRYSNDTCKAWDATNNTKSNYTTWKDTVKSKLSSSVKKSTERLSHDYQSYPGEATGKAHPDTIVHFLSDCCVGKTEEQLKAVLDTFCIGADCSGFVSRAIAYVMQNMGWTYMAQFKTIGPLSESHAVKNDQKVYTLNVGPSDVLYESCTYYKLYRNNDDIVYDNIYIRDSNSVVNKPITRQEEQTLLSSNLLLGSRLIYRFRKETVEEEQIVNGKKKKTSKKVIKWDRINKDLTNDSTPQITSLRPGDIVTMSSSPSFGSDFHIAIICNVGIDLTGPYFITADSTPYTLKESIDNITTRKTNLYSVLKRPNAFETVKADDLDEKKAGHYNQKGNGVRYILHRDFGFFNGSDYLAFRRPYAFSLYYRGFDLTK